MPAPGPLGGAALVGLGGAAGAVARYGVVRAAARRGAAGATHSWAVTAINLSGSALLGGLAAAPGAGAGARLLLGTGACGGFTTFSTYSVESAGLLQAGRLSVLALHFILNGVGCPVCALAGGSLVRALAV